MGTPKGERRRDALTAAAAELLGSGGFDAVRHRAVAEKAGLPLASTTYYFASLDELVTAAVEQHGRDGLAEGRERLAALPDDPVDDAELVELFLDQLLGAESRDGGLDAVLLRYEQLVGSGRRPYLAPLMREMRVEFDALLAEILARGGPPPRRGRAARPRRDHRRGRDQRAHRGRPRPPRGRPRGAPSAPWRANRPHDHRFGAQSGQIRPLPAPKLVIMHGVGRGGGAPRP